MKIKKMITKNGNIFVLRIKETGLGITLEWDVQLRDKKILDGSVREDQLDRKFISYIKDQVDQYIDNDKRRLEDA